MTLRLTHLLIAAALWLAATSALAATASVQQTIQLQPGWNAVQLEIDPEQREFATVFAGVPIASVWRWRPEQGGAQFVSDPAEGLDTLDGWFGWYPASKPEAFLSNLFQFESHAAYLIKLEGTAPAQITLTGKPLYLPRRWQGDAFTLTGLAVDPGNAPSFVEYFAQSGAHQGQPVYKLGSDGHWNLVAPASEVIRPGRAYWIYTQGNSSFNGPLRVVLDQGESLEFGATAESLRVVLRNVSGANGSITLVREGGSTLPMAVRNVDTQGNVTWTDLGATLALPAPTDADLFVTLAVKRSAFTDSRMEQVFSIVDEQGVRVRLLAGGDTLQSLTPVLNKSTGKASLINPLAGLWVGSIEIDAVSEAQPGSFATVGGERVYTPGTPAPTPTPSRRSFSMRVLMHVDAAGNAQLLKDVIQMWQDGTTRPSTIDPSLNEVDQPGHFVLVTDKTRLSQFSGANIRDSSQVGRRFSTIGYDFAGDTLALTGGFGPGLTLNADLTIGSEHPTNPFLHRPHPDHNNLDEQYLPLPPARAEAYAVRRQQTFVFAATEPNGSQTPGWGSSVLGGTFTEDLSGLHRRTLRVGGTFRLERAATTASLNQ